MAFSNNFMSDFATIIFQFVKVSLFYALRSNFFRKGSKRVCEGILSYFVIKIGIKKNLDGTQIFTDVFSFQNSHERKDMPKCYSHVASLAILTCYQQTGQKLNQEIFS